MRLQDLEARFIGNLSEDGKTFSHDNISFDQAQGLMMLCPLCLTNNGGSKIGVHSVICWFRGRGVPDDLDPKPGRWTPSGTSLDDLTFIPPPASVSVQLLGGCNWHGFVVGGGIK